MLWRGLILPNLYSTHLHDFLHNFMPSLAKTIIEGIGAAAKDVPNPEYAHWWALDEKVIRALLSSMDEDISTQLIGCKTTAAVWTVVHTMFGA